MYREYLIELRETLAILFDTEDSYRLVARDSGFDLARINFGRTIQQAWDAILGEAARQGKIIDVIDRALQDYPKNGVLLQQQRSITHFDANDQPITDNRLSWKSTRTADALEKIMGMQATFLPISWFETGIQQSRCVVRIKHHDHTIATGFLVKQNCILTNHHVLPTEDVARQAIIQFNYQKNIDGLDYDPTDFHLDPDAGGQLEEPATHRLVYRNEGININCIIQELHDMLRLRS